MRDKEDALAARKNTRNGFEQQIAKLESSSGNEKKISDLEELLHQAYTNDEPLEKEVQLLERKAIRDSEHAKSEAIREVSSLFCGRIPGGLTYRYSTEKSL